MSKKKKEIQKGSQKPQGRSQRPTGSGRERKPSSKSECNPETAEKSNGRASAKFEYPGQDNDVSWYKGSSEHAAIIEKSANAANFETIAGRPIPVTNIVEGYCTPAICAMRMVTGPGVSQADVGKPSALTLASRKTWALMRTVLTNASKYQPADVSMLICAMDEVLSLAVHINRMFRLVNTYKVNNIYFPDEFLRAFYDFTEADIEYLRDNKLNLIANYNQACIACAPLTIPNEYGFIRRHTFLYANIFADGKTAKSQFFGMKPYGYRKWNDLGNQGSELAFHLMYDTSLKGRTRPEWLIDTFWDLINAITGSESALEILGDIWKVFGKGTAFAPMPASEFDYLDVVFDNYNVLGQINNAYILGVPYTAITENGAYDIKQDVNTNSLIFNPSFTTTSPATVAQFTLMSTNSGHNNRILLNSHLESPSADDVIELTRLMPTVTENLKSAEPYFMLSSMGCDFVDSFELYGIKGPGKAPLMFSTNYIPADDEHALDKMSALPAFDWHPPMYFVENTPSTLDAPVQMYPFMDIDNYAVVDTEQLKLLNDNIQMAMWNVGDLTK